MNANNGKKKVSHLLGYSHENYQLIERLLLALFNEKYKLWALINQVYHNVFSGITHQAFNSLNPEVVTEFFFLLCCTINPPISGSSYNIDIVKRYLINFFTLVKNNLSPRYFIEASDEESPNAQIYKVLIQMLLISMHEIAYVDANNLINVSKKLSPVFNGDSTTSKFQEAITVLALNNEKRHMSTTFGINLPACGDCVTFSTRDDKIFADFTEIKINEELAKGALANFPPKNKTNKSSVDVFLGTNFNYLQKSYFSSSIKVMNDGDDLVFSFKEFFKVAERGAAACSASLNLCVVEQEPLRFSFPKDSYKSILKLYRRDMKKLERNLKDQNLAFSLPVDFTKLTWGIRELGTVDPVNMSVVNKEPNVNNSVLLAKNLPRIYRTLPIPKSKSIVLKNLSNTAISIFENIPLQKKNNDSTKKGFKLGNKLQKNLNNLSPANRNILDKLEFGNRNKSFL